MYTAERAFCCLLLLHYHGVVVCAGWNHHSLVSVATVYTLVVHDVLREVLAAKANQNERQN